MEGLVCASDGGRTTSAGGRGWRRGGLDGSVGQAVNGFARLLDGLLGSSS
jgi:hypothetical protein